MTRFFVLMVMVLAVQAIYAQELPSGTQQQLENLAELTENETVDDILLQELESYKKRPLNLNEAEADELHVFPFLSALQIQNFLAYRKSLGGFIDIYELQSIPGWDISTIRKMQPFITIRKPVTFSASIKPRLKGGAHFLLLRSSRILENSDDYDTSRSAHYLGNPNYLLLRYQYKYNNLLQYGFTAENDAGEQFFKGAQSKGFDFYSAHLFTRNVGIFKAIALGDFSVNLGQGLVQWQSISFMKGAEAASIKKQAPVLKHYTSAGEFYFNRGVGLTIQKWNTEATLFGSVRKLDANIVKDSISGSEAVSSFISSGMHRSSSEIMDKASVEQHSIGGNLSWKVRSFHIGFNAVAHNFSSPVEKRDDPYNLFALKGSSAMNMSTDYSFTYRNFHFFGEAAADENFYKAILSGLLASLHSKVDLSVLHRHYEKDYVTVYGKAFSESTMPTNESGLYLGIRLRPTVNLTINAYSDVYKFAWLKYRVDAPSTGRDYMIQVTYQPNKQMELYTRYRNERKYINNTAAETELNEVIPKLRQQWRVHMSCVLASQLTWQNRMDVVWYDKGGNKEEEGFLFFTGLNYKPLKKLSANGRILFFETSGFYSRIYAYENDVSYSFTTPFYNGNGLRYYVNLNYDVLKHLSVWLKIARTSYQNNLSIDASDSGTNAMAKTEIRLQAALQF
ncbi:helix-hairpin-helix domain-containing protein [Chitinophagaceae bacterium LB-8]|uniref:Helix-hairpin-helix domain-containing protein n=1 Tax=Paraflavisolibacter caeni TaxID=2982496 RepID=A0A9X2XPJ5_9BACT|nr:helix-hairpin-helix domain-containing protein [Paraflavisolibacter caeni]MCU7551054.1 helix-hairpin-helix domain-containing protein [Paraflavisolibacter caeni]